MSVCESECTEEGITCLEDIGAGRPWVLVRERGSHYTSYIETARDIASKSGRVILLEVASVTDTNWTLLASALEEKLFQKGVRHASFLSFGGAGVLVQRLCLIHPKIGRSLVFVDATSRGHPSLLMRLADAIERSLPLGLPLRKNIKGFDSKPSLHRFRCPVIVAVTELASEYERGESRVMAKALPTAWYVELRGEEELSPILTEFQGVAAKCPQKRRTRATPQ